MSTTLMGWLDLLEGGSTALVHEKYGTDDSTNLTLQFYSMIRYFNRSGNGLLHFPPDCDGPWACNALIDWPAEFRDGFDMNQVEDAVRNGLGVVSRRRAAQA